MEVLTCLELQVLDAGALVRGLEAVGIGVLLPARAVEHVGDLLGLEQTDLVGVLPVTDVQVVQKLGGALKMFKNI